jgi:hypothetical protein
VDNEEVSKHDDVGADGEDDVVSVASRDDITLRPAWHVFRCCDDRCEVNHDDDDDRELKARRTDVTPTGIIL